MPKASATSGVQLWRWIVPIAVGIIIWFLPVPAGLNPKAIHMLGIFLGTIAAILTNPMPSGAVMMTALAVSYFSGTLTLSQSLSGLASGTVWMIFSAYVLSLGFVQSGLGPPYRVPDALEVRRFFHRYRVFARLRRPCDGSCHAFRDGSLRRHHSPDREVN